MSVRDAILYPFQPTLHTIAHYDRTKFRKDVVAGLTVSVVELPQAMAYAVIAGVPPTYGIYASILQGVLGALLSSSEHLTTGPTNTQSLLIAAALGEGALGVKLDPARYLQLAFALTVMKGLFQLAFWAGRFGRLVRLISRSVIVGIATGAGVLIVSGQLAAFLGVRRGPESPNLIGLPADIARLWPNLGHADPRAAGIGLGTIALVVVARRINRFLPGALLAIVLSSLLVWWRGWGDELRTVGALRAQFPSFDAPPFDWPTIRALASGALALAILGGIESVAIAKSLAGRSGEKIDANREFFAQGLKNTITGFFQCIPGSASFTRSALDYDAGAETRFAAVLNALFVAAMFFIVAPAARFIPYAALAGVLLVVAWGLMEPRYFFRVWRADRSDAIVFAATLLATLLIPLQYAVFVGIGLNVAFYLRSSARLHLIEMTPTATGGFRERAIEESADDSTDRYDLERAIRDKKGRRQIVFLQLDGDLFFATAESLQDRLDAIARGGVRFIVLRLKRCHAIDASALHVLDRCARELRESGGQLLLCGIRADVMRGLVGYGLAETVGADNLFASDDDLFASSRRALARAESLSKRLTQTSIDADRYTLTTAAEIEYQI